MKNNIPHIALRVPNTDTLNSLTPWLARVPFILYGSLTTCESLRAAGYTGELACMLSKGPDAPVILDTYMPRLLTINCKRITQDFERGPDFNYALPDPLPIVAACVAVLKKYRSRIKLIPGLQMDYAERSYLAPLASNPPCNIAESIAAEIWNTLRESDETVLFGESGSTQTAESWEAANAAWMDYYQTTHPYRGWWAATGLTDKNNDGSPDINPHDAAKIAIAAAECGATAIAVIWLGKSGEALMGASTEFDLFMNDWCGYWGV